MVFFAWKVIKHKRTRVKPRTKGLWLWALRMSTNWSPQNTSLGSKQESKEWQKQLPKEKKSQIDWLLLSGIVRYWQKKIRQVTESLEARKQGIHIKLKGNSTTGSCTDYESFITTDWEAHSNLLTQIKSKCFSTFHASSPACGFTLRFHIVVREPSAAPKLQYLGLKFNWKEYFLSSLDDNNSHRSYSVTDTGHFFSMLIHLIFTSILYYTKTQKSKATFPSLILLGTEVAFKYSYQESWCLQIKWISCLFLYPKHWTRCFN
jgi:hypothetical protein